MARDANRFRCDSVNPDAFRSVFVICVTLPLAALFSFLLIWLLRVLHIIDIQANIMSLAGITISIGIMGRRRRIRKSESGN